MPVQRRRNLLRQRRRVDDDGDDDTSVINEAVDDSQSDASLPSDADDGADADDSDLSDTDAPQPVGDKNHKSKSNGAVKMATAESKHTTGSATAKQDSSEQQSFQSVKDTDMMLNGIQVSDDITHPEAIDFESAGDEGQPAQTSNDNSKNITPAERRRREHEEYKKKRDENPAFIPNRGAFFMHDQRSSGQGGFRGFGRGRGRGRIGEMSV